MIRSVNMQRAEREVINNIIRSNDIIDGLQKKIEDEQEAVISDTVSPALKVVEKLIELDNRRVDICNLRVLYAFIRRGLGDGIYLLGSGALCKERRALYEKAKRQVEKSGYTLDRAREEFEYIFKKLKAKISVGYLPPKISPDCTVVRA